tara:strand:- start:211 stop:471 length:261 start_codon:yes stop_codon:yes gene_type:complete
MKIPKYLGQQVQLTVALVDEDTIKMAIEVGGYAGDRTFVGKFKEEFKTSQDVVETLKAACKSGRQDMSNTLGLEVQNMRVDPKNEE